MRTRTFVLHVVFLLLDNNTSYIMDNLLKKVSRRDFVGSWNNFSRKGKGDWGKDHNRKNVKGRSLCQYKLKVSVPCCCCCPRSSCRSSVASWSCQKSSRLRVIAVRIDPFSLNATKLVLLSVFTSNLETICDKRCSKSLLKNTKIPRRVDVRRLKTSLLKTWGGLLLFSFPPKK